MRKFIPFFILGISVPLIIAAGLTGTTLSPSGTGGSPDTNVYALVSYVDLKVSEVSGPTNGISSATATNIALHQADLARIDLTNYANTLAVNGTNQSLKIGNAGTNYANILADNGTNESARASSAVLTQLQSSNYVTQVTSTNIADAVASSKFTTSGTVTLASGTNRVTTTAIAANSKILLTYVSVDGNVSTIYYRTSEISAGNHFVIRSGNTDDTNKVNWWIMP